MKRAERHHLKENELKHLARQAAEIYGTRKQTVSWAMAAGVIAAAVGIGYFAWRERVQTNAGTLLAEALAVQDARIGPPPAPGARTSAPYFPTERERSEATLKKLRVAADAYPSTDAGLFARYQQATIETALGNYGDAAKTYQQVIDRAGGRIHGQMARLGLAESQARAGQYDPAISAFKGMVERTDGPLPLDGLLMELGRVYRDAGKTDDAQAAFLRIVHEFPDSPFNADAQRELDALKKS